MPALEKPYHRRETSPYFFYPMFHPKKDRLSGNDAAVFYESLDNKCKKGTRCEVYIHIPFCDSFCHMCACYKTHTPRDKSILKQYVDQLKREIGRYSKKTYVQSLDMESVYFGGGTPSVLTPDMIEDLLCFTKDHLPVKKNTEITFEGDVRTLKDRYRLTALRNSGCNRISFGVQTFNPLSRKLSGLVPTKDEILRCIEVLKDLDYRINFDIMYGLPSQNLSVFKEDLNTAMEVGADGLDLYETVLYPTTKLFQLRHSRDLPDGDERMEMLSFALGFLREQGFRQKSRAIFQKKNNFCRKLAVDTYFCPDTLAIGDSAIGCMNDFAYRNDSPLMEYMDWKDPKVLPLRLGLKLDQHDRYTRRILSLARNLTLNKKRFWKEIDYFKDAIQKLEQNGLVAENAHQLYLTDVGRLWTDNIITDLISTQQKMRSWKIIY